MPTLQTVLGDLNGAFGKDNIKKLARKRAAFAPGKRLGSGLIVSKKHALWREYQTYLEMIPGSIQQALLNVMFHALGTKPRPTQITFAWQPGYDFEITVHEVGDTTTTKGGITVLLKSPYDKRSLLTSQVRARNRKAPAKRKAAKRKTR